MNNTRFATALHILTLLADQEGELLSSEWIAGSLNVNPVIVRKELSVLIEAGLVQSKKGKEGGYTLVKNSGNISLAEVYMAVKNSEILGKKNLSPNPNCPIGKNINAKLEQLYVGIDHSVLQQLQEKTLKNFVASFH